MEHRGGLFRSLSFYYQELNLVNEANRYAQTALFLEKFQMITFMFAGVIGGTLITFYKSRKDKKSFQNDPEILKDYDVLLKFRLFYMFLSIPVILFYLNVSILNHHYFDFLIFFGIALLGLLFFNHLKKRITNHVEVRMENINKSEPISFDGYKKFDSESFYYAFPFILIMAFMFTVGSLFMTYHKMNSINNIELPQTLHFSPDEVDACITTDYFMSCFGDYRYDELVLMYQVIELRIIIDDEVELAQSYDVEWITRGSIKTVKVYKYDDYTLVLDNPMLVNRYLNFSYGEPLKEILSNVNWRYEIIFGLIE